MELDVTDTEEKIGHVAREAVDVWGRVDVVVNNAGCVDKHCVSCVILTVKLRFGMAGTLEEGGYGSFTV